MRDEVAQVVHPATKVLGLLGDTVVLGECRCGGVVHDVLDRDARELNDLAYEAAQVRRAFTGVRSGADLGLGG